MAPSLKYLDDLHEQLKLISMNHQIAFAVTLAEKLLHYYLACEDYPWCNPEQITDVLGRIWSHAQGACLLSDEDVRHFDEILSRFCPDMDEDAEFDSLDFCIALEFALKSCLPVETTEYAASVAEVILDNIGRRMRYITLDPEFWDSSIVADEVAKQEQLLSYLKIIDKVDSAVVAYLRGCTTQNK